MTALLRGGPAAPRCSSWPCAAQALWPRQALPPRQRDGLRCFIGSATGAQPQRHGRRIFKKHVSGLDDFEKIPNLNWDKFDKGSTGAIAMDIRPGTSSTGKVWRVEDWGEGGKEAYCN